MFLSLSWLCSFLQENYQIQISNAFQSVRPVCERRINVIRINEIKIFNTLNPSGAQNGRTSDNCGKCVDRHSRDFESACAPDELIVDCVSRDDGLKLH